MDKNRFKEVIKKVLDENNDILLKLIDEKAVSKKQQQAMGIAYAAKVGEMSPDKLKGAAKEMHKSMTKKELELLYPKLKLPINLANEDFRRNQKLIKKCYEVGREIGK